MEMTELTLASIGEIEDGRVNVAFQNELRRVVKDCLERSGDKKPRIISLEIHITPQPSESGTCEGVDGEFKIKSKVPHRQSKAYDFRVHKNGSLSFAKNNPEDRDQPTFDDLGPDGKIKKS